MQLAWLYIPSHKLEIEDWLNYFISGKREMGFRLTIQKQSHHFGKVLLDF